MQTRKPNRLKYYDYSNAGWYLGEENFHPLQRTNLSNMVKGFKIGATKWFKSNDFTNFKWQRPFYERIIRNENELFNIRKYIEQNPLKWDLEKGTDNVEL
jgi:hypothetical protein